MRAHPMSATAFVAGVLVALVLSACSSPAPVRSRTKDLAADRNAKNVALLLGAPSMQGTESYLPGVLTDIQAMTQLFSKPELGFQVITKNYATSSDFLTLTASAAAGLDEQSTLFLYYSGHGTEQGTLVAQDGYGVKVSSMIAQIAKVRKTPFKRLILVMDSCFSGQNVDGDAAFIEDVNTLNGSVSTIQGDFTQATSTTNRPFTQALVIGAARASEMSLDRGSMYGGVFTYSWRQTLSGLFQKPSATIGEMLNATISATQANSRGKHTPVFRAVPQAMLTDPLMGANTSTGPAVFSAYFALSGADEANPVILVSVPSSVAGASAVLCRGEATECRTAVATQQIPLQFRSDLPIAGRAIFAAAQQITPESGAVYTAFFRDSSGNELGMKSIRFTSR